MSEPLNFKWLIEFGNEKQDPKVIVEFYKKIQVIPNTKRVIFLAAQISLWEEKQALNILAGNWVPDEDAED